MEWFRLAETVSVACTNLISVQVLIWFPACSIEQSCVLNETASLGLWSGASFHLFIEENVFACGLYSRLWFGSLFWLPEGESRRSSPVCIV